MNKAVKSDHLCTRSHNTHANIFTSIYISYYIMRMYHLNLHIYIDIQTYTYICPTIIRKHKSSFFFLLIFILETRNIWDVMCIYIQVAIHSFASLQVNLSDFAVIHTTIHNNGESVIFSCLHIYIIIIFSQSIHFIPIVNFSSRFLDFKYRHDAWM